MKPRRRWRVASAAILVSALLTWLGCGDTRYTNGRECLRDEDCLSGTCAARVCVPAPTLFEGWRAGDSAKPRTDGGVTTDAEPSDASRATDADPTDATTSGDGGI